MTRNNNNGAPRIYVEESLDAGGANVVLEHNADITINGVPVNSGSRIVAYHNDIPNRSSPDKRVLHLPTPEQAYDIARELQRGGKGPEVMRRFRMVSARLGGLS